MLKTLRRLAVVIVVVASACSTQQYVWVHPAKDAQQYEADNAYCLAQSRSTRTLTTLPENPDGGNTPSLGAAAGTFSSGWDTISTVEAIEVQNTMHSRCMKRIGWRRQVVEQAAEQATE